MFQSFPKCAAVFRSKRTLTLFFVFYFIPFSLYTFTANIWIPLPLPYPRARKHLSAAWKIVTGTALRSDFAMMNQSVSFNLHLCSFICSSLLLGSFIFFVGQLRASRCMFTYVLPCTCTHTRTLTHTYTHIYICANSFACVRVFRIWAVKLCDRRRQCSLECQRERQKKREQLNGKEREREGRRENERYRG